jgi:peptide-methionine (S)-S-oxide reductase
MTPTTLNRQGNDMGTSYRSAIFYATPEQQRVAEAYIAQLTAEHVFKQPIVTQVVALRGFYAGEEYHQDYALKNPDNPYIMVCDRPKIATLKKDYPQLYVEYKGH